MTIDKLCANQVRVLRNQIYTEAEYKCRTCQDFNQECYRPFEPQGLLIRKGQLAYVLQREGVHV